MNEQYVWPLVGVFLGWLLSAIAAGWKAREADRRSIGKLLAKLIRIHSHVRILQAASETFKDNVSNWEEYEQIRKYVSSKHFLEPIIDIERLHLAVDEISGVYPVESLQLRELIDLLSKAKSASFIAASKNKDIYVRLLSAHEVGLDLAAKELEKGIRVLALKHSVVTCIQIIIKLRKGVRGITGNEDFMKKFSAETWSAIRQAQQDAQADGLASGDPAA
ncbi:hypothetical protein HC024_02980 [Methylococcaceae bacterium WWC4]|nr:hypothetical protein [Methylococcaceae bacterium WWC4]